VVTVPIQPIAPKARPARHRVGLRRWHRWCGLAVVLFLLVAAVSGSLLVYKKELIRLLITPQASLPVDYNIEQMAAQLDAIIASSGAGPPFIKAPNLDEPYWALTTDGNTVLLSVVSLQAYRDNLWLLDALAFVRRLHTELLTGLVGEALLLASGFGGLFLSVTGLMVWWPTRKSFRWHWVVPRPRPAQLLVHSHRHTGAAAAALLVLVIATGGVMLWQKLIWPLLPPLAVASLPDRLETGLAPPPSQLLLKASAAVADGWPTYIRLSDDDSATASVRFRLPGEWHPNGRTSVTFDLATGQANVSERSDQAAPARRIVNQMYPLHSGYGMGWLYAALIFISGIAILWLGISGGVSYLKRRKA